MNQLDRVTIRVFRFLFAVVALHVLPANAMSDATNSIQALNVSSASDGKYILAVTLKNPLASLPKHFTVSNPPRIAFDFADTTSDLRKPFQEFNQGDLRSVNVVPAGTRTRLVVNLAKMMVYDTKVDGNNLLITLGNVSAAAATTRFAETLPNTQAHSLRNVDFHRGKNGEGRIEVTLSDASTGIDFRQQGTKIIVDFIKSGAPSNLQRKLDVIDFATPVESIDTFTQGENVRMVITPMGLWEHAAYQTDNKFVIEIKPKKPDEPGKKDNKPVYSGEKLTLNFQSIQVREALSVIADFTGLNIVISDSVSGNVTLRLKDVPWDQALEIILQSKGLDMRKNGNVIQVAPREEIAAREKVTMTVAQDVADLEPLHTENFKLSYQKAADVINLVTNKDQRMLSKRGSAVEDQRTNTLFVQDTPSRLEDVRRLIQQVDVPVRQVMIEARFVSANEKFSRTLGGRLSYVSANQAAPAAGFHAGSGQLGNSTGGSINLPGANSGLGGLTLSLFNPANTKTLQLELTATELEGTSKNIASPRVVTADNVEAIIKSGASLPYQQCTTSGGCNTLFKDAVLGLKVTPQITPDDHVNMKVLVTQDTVGSYIGSIPSIDTKFVTTEVLVENGGTVVIGGVYTKETTMSDTKVPLFGDIPIIGWLFKNSGKIDNKFELLVFITPMILKDSLNIN